MKKFFTLIAVAAMAFAAQANVLTVCESTEDDYVSQYIPIYGYFYDAEGMSQLIYPAEDLQDMKGGQITELTFYTPAAAWGEDYASYVIQFSGGKIELSLMEVEQNGFNDATIDGATVVASLVPEAGGMYLTFVLDEPYTYNGGNLLVQSEVVETGSWGRTYFAGVGDCFGRNTAYAGYDYYGTWNEGYLDFLPMLSFTYEGGQAPVEKTDAPGSTKENFVYKADNLYYNAYTITLSETEPSEIYYRIGIMNEEGQYEYGQWMLYSDVLEFVVPGTYMVEAYAVAADKAESDHIYDGFVVSVLTDVEEIKAGKEVANVRYFNLAGQEMAQPAGLTIQVTTFTDGTISTAKVMK